MLESMKISKGNFRQLPLARKRQLLRELSGELKFQNRRIKAMERAISDLRAEINHIDTELERAITRRNIEAGILADLSELV